MPPLETQPEPLLEVRRLGKQFGANLVLRDIDFDVAEGQIVSVIGENGAGKSTFAKILAGIIAPDRGEIQLHGERVEFQSPRDALLHKVGFIPQELAFVPTMTVAENVLLNSWPRTAGFVSPSAVVRRARGHLDRMQIDVRPTQRMSDIRLAEQQMIEIVKVMARDIRVLILDEPTASLSNAESDRLMAMLRSLASEGLGIILISHRFDEVLDVSDRVDVFRNARRVFSGSPMGLTSAILVEHMLGRASAPADAQQQTVSRSGEELLRISDWSHAAHPQLHGVDLAVHAGEILCLFGVRGSGVEVIAEGLTGRRPAVTGRLIVQGEEVGIPRTPRRAIKAGVAFIPPDRKRQGLVLQRDIQENVTYLVPRLISRIGFIRRRARSGLAGDLSRRMQIRSRSVSQIVSDLSGGNQQKVLLASRLVTAPRILVLEEPTRGVDVGARLQIHEILRETAGQGAAIVLVTPDGEEAAAISTRVLAVRFGRIVDELTGSRITQAELLRAVSADRKAG